MIAINNNIDKEATHDNQLVNMICECMEKNKYFIKVIVDLVSNKRKNLKDETNKLYFEAIVDKGLVSNKISKSEAEKFKNLWYEFEEKSELKGKKQLKKGDVLELLIRRIGPMDSTMEKHTRCIGVKVYEQNCKNYECMSKKDFDVVFFDKYDKKNIGKASFIIFKGNVELHECKHDIRTFMPRDDESSKEEIEKLKFIKTIYQKVNDDRFKFLLPTFLKATYEQEDILKEMGFEFIKIINGKDILNKIGRSGRAESILRKKRDLRI